MPSQPTPAEPPNAADQRAEDARYYRQILHDMIDIGVGLVSQLPEQATPRPTPDQTAPGEFPATDLSAAYERLTRAVRRSIILAQKLAEPTPAPAGQHRFAARKRILRTVEDTIQRETEGAEAQSLHAELLDRMDSPDLDDEIDDRPVDEIIAEICHDLGLSAFPGTHPWKRRTPTDIAQLCARATPMLVRLPTPFRTTPIRDG